MTSVPTYDKFIGPVLRVLARHTNGLKTADVYQQVADEVGLTDEQRDELLPSGRQPYYQNRIGWAYDRIKRAGLGESVRRGHWALNEAGVDLVESKPDGLTEAEITEIANTHRVIYSLSDVGDAASSLVEESEVSHAPSLQTPKEAMDWALAELNQSVANELMEFILGLTPDQFEVLVLDVLLAMGYGASRRSLTRTGGSGDGGIDGIITLDRLGLEKVYIQAKRWAPGNNVGRPELQGFYGALAIRKANKGVFITTSTFTTPAVEYAAQVSDGIVLVDGEMLTQLMIEFGVGVSTQRVVKIVRADSDYFDEL